MSEEQREVYSVDVAGLKRDLPLFEVASGVRIAIVNILGDTELVEAVSKELSKKLAQHNPEVIVTAEAKSIPLAHVMSMMMDVPYVVLRKKYKPYMGDAVRAETLSITTGEIQELFLDEKDIKHVKGRRVSLLDDVISTGSTLQAMRLIMKKVDVEVVAEAAIFTEGDRSKWVDIVSLGHLPVFAENDD